MEITDEQNSEAVTPNSDLKYEIIGLRFKESGKTYYFDPCGNKYNVGEDIVVETARGIELGTVYMSNKFAGESEVILPLRPVIRKATSEDINIFKENKKKEKEAFDICCEKIKEHKLEMKLVEVEYTFDKSKLLFYFTADGRVDFRELVKDLAFIFRTRIELRQIGIRDETKLIGGLGVCGMPFCCKRFLSDFVQVSIKMAKEQNLSLNSQKISGACGRLMCCLRYEHETYAEAIKSLPKQDALVDTPDGRGVVCDINTLAGIVKVKFSDGEQSFVIRTYSAENIKPVAKQSQ